MQQLTVVNDSSFLKYSWTHVAIFNTSAWRFLMQSEGSMVKHIQPEVSCLALHVLWFLWIPWIFSQYYAWCLVKDLNSLQLCIAKCDFWHVFLFLLTLLSWNLAQSDEPWSSFACKDASFLPKHDTLTYYQFTCLLCRWIITWLLSFFSIILPLSQRFWNVLQSSKLNVFIFTKYIYFGQWKLWKSFLCTFVN